MTTPTGTIGMSDVNVELGKSSSASITLNDADVRSLAGILSGTISLNDLRGKAWKAKYITVGSDSSPHSQAYPWSSSGFGAKYANAATIVAADVNGAASNPPSTTIAYANESSTSGRITAYPWSSSGYGTKYANPSTIPGGSGYCTAFSPNNASIAVGILTPSPFVLGYPWSDASGFGTKFSDPTSPPVSRVEGVGFKSDSSVIALASIASSSNPTIHAYAWSSSTGFGSKYSDPGLTTSGYEVEFSTNGSSTVIAIAVSTSPYVKAWTWSSGFGTAFSNPATSMASGGRCLKFSYAGNAILIGSAASPYIHAYPWSNSTGFGTKYANPSTIPSATTVGASGNSFAQGDTAIAVTTSSSPYVYAYAWSTSGFGSKFSDPATLPAGASNDVAFY